MVESEDTRRLAVQLVKSAIDDFAFYYLENPFHFYTENDLHCRLFKNILLSLEASGLNEPRRTLDGKMSILLHKEYPTKARYRRNRAPRDPEKAERGARGHFDLCLWDPVLMETRLFRSDVGVCEQETFIAVELDLVESRVQAEEALHHVKWDLLKLSDPDNHVEHGFMLFFVRDWSNKDEFMTLVKEQLKLNGETTALYVESSQERKIRSTFQDLQGRREI